MESQLADMLRPYEDTTAALSFVGVGMNTSSMKQTLGNCFVYVRDSGGGRWLAPPLAGLV